MSGAWPGVVDIAIDLDVACHRSYYPSWGVTERCTNSMLDFYLQHSGWLTNVCSPFPVDLCVVDVAY